jgi:glucokinase
VILAGDLGGTNARLALFRLRGGSAEIAWRACYSARAADWTEHLARARAESGASELRGAVLAVAGPVRDGCAQLTNLGWSLTAERVAAELGLARAGLLNDLEAAAHGLEWVRSDDLAVLGPAPRAGRGNRVLCSPGTGLGVAAALWDGERHHVTASEGGHATFAPLDDEDRALAQFLAERHGHASWERVLSGPGIRELYAFERDVRGLAEPPELAHALEREGTAAITRAALAGEVPLAVRTLERFAHLLGCEAGNLALEFLAHGGLFLGGGIPPRLRAFLERPAFLAAFLAKGRMRPLLAGMCVSIVLDPDCALLGAARRAFQLSGMLPSR